MTKEGRSCISWRTAGSIGLLFAPVLFVFLPIIIGKDVFWFFDVTLFHHPNYSILDDAISSRSISSVIWNPNLGTGFPLWAEGQIGVLYPINWIATFLFEPLTAYSVVQVVHYLLAAVFSFAYARSLGLRYPAAVVTALAFAFSGHLVGAMAANTILRSAIWLPLMFWGIEMFARRRRFTYLGVSSFGLAMQVVGGYPATAALGGLSVASYGAFRMLCHRVDPGARLTFGEWGGRILRAVLVVGVAVILGFSLAAGHLLPQLELSLLSERVHFTYEDLTRWSLPPFHLITLVWPLVFHNSVEQVVWGVENLGRTAIYVGIIPLALAIMAGFDRHRRRPDWVIFFAAMAVVSFALALGRYNPLYRGVTLIPGFRNFRAPSTFGYLLDFSLALLAGRGLDLLLSKLESFHRRRLLIWAGALLLLTLPVLAWQIWVHRAAVQGQLTQLMEPWRAWMKPNRDPALLLRSVQASASPRNPTAFMPLVMLTAAAGWIALRRSRLRSNLWAWCGVGLVIVDLVFFATAIRKTQTASRSVAQAQPWAVDVLDDQIGMDRVAVTWSLYPWYTSHQPNRLATEDIATLQVYTPLAPRKLNEYLRLARQNRDHMARLLEIASVRYALDAESQTYVGVPFIAQRPLAVAGLWHSPQAGIDLPAPMEASRIQLVFAATEWPPLETDQRARLTLLSAGGAEETWCLSGETDRSLGPQMAIPQPVDRPVLRDPLSWRGEDFSMREWPLYYVEIHPSTTSLERVTITPPAHQTLYLLGMVVESSSTDDRWVAGVQPFSQAGFSQFYQHARGAIYEVDDPLPRAYVVHRLQTVSDSQALESLLDPDFDHRNEAVVTQPPDVPIRPANVSEETVRIVGYLPTQVDIAVDLASPGLLVLTDLNYPGWRAFVDDVREPIVSTNYLFRGVYVDQGSHHIRFVYSPVYLQVGVAISFTAATGLLGGILLDLLRSRK